MIRKLALTSIRGNVTFTTSGATAWFVVPGVRWAFRDDGERDQTIVDAAQRFAALTGRRIHVRVTTRPWSAAGWWAAMEESAISPLPAWSAHLDAEAAHLDRLSLSDKVIYLGVDLDRPLAGAARLLGKRHEDAKLLEQTDEVSRTVSAAGLNCEPASQAEAEWLVRRSVALGCPPPDDVPSFRSSWDVDDIAEFASTATWTVEPFGRTVKVTADIPTSRHGLPRDHEIDELLGDEAAALDAARLELREIEQDIAPDIPLRVVRYVCVLTVGRMAELDSASPWLSKTDRLGFPVEISVTANVLEAKQVIKGVQSSILRVRAQLEHFAEHHQPPPHSLPQAQARALSIQDEVERGMTGLSSRCDVWVRLAVSGATEEEALARATKVIDLYSPAITIAHTSDQYNLAREMIPGEPLSTTSYRRRMPVTTLAGSMPQVTHHVGHESGHYIGFTSQGSARRPVLWDLHRSTEVRERSGLTLVAATLGGGKSALLFQVVYKAALAGIHTVVLDPSGPLSRLCELPELKAVSRHINLLQARPGTLSPYRVVPEPVRSHFPTKEAWEHAISMAQASRITLTADILAQFLPSVIAEQPETFIALSEATGRVGGYPQVSARMVIGELVRAGGHSAHVGRILEQVADLPAAQLVMPSGSSLDADGSEDDALLTVISMKGLALPRENMDRKEWSSEERISTALLHLAAWLAQRSVYQRDMQERKLIVVDEAHALARVASGRLLMSTSARDSRKYNVRSIFSSQGVEDLLGADIGNLVDSVFIGSTTDRAAQEAALKVLGVPTGQRYEEVLGTLASQTRGAAGRSGARDFVYNDGEGGCERIAIDLQSLPPHVRDALDTTPAPTSRVVAKVA